MVTDSFARLTPSRYITSGFSQRTSREGVSRAEDITSDFHNERRAKA